MRSWCSTLCCMSYKKKKSYKDADGSADILTVPQQVREKIWRCLDNESKKMVSLVCSLFKSEIDLGAGLNVRVNATNRDNINFVQTVEVKKAVVNVVMNSSLDLFRCKWNVEYLQTHCVIGQYMFKSLILPLSENLLSLSIMDRSLMSTSILPHDVALKASTKNNNGYIFSRLLALKIQYGHFSGSSNNLQVFNFNMITIMKSFFCPRLLCFIIIIHPDPNTLRAMSEQPHRVPKEHIEWENNPLKAFVALHRDSLRLLDLFLYSREINEDNYDNYRYPLDLKDFIIVIPFITVPKEFPARCYWKDINMNSTKLNRLILQIEFWHNYVNFFSVTSIIFEKNSRTLTIIRLESFALEEETYNEQANYARNSIGFSLNFNLFACCSQLKVLEVYQLNAKKNLVGVFHSL